MRASIRQFNEWGRVHMTDKGHPGHSYGVIYAPIINDLNRRPKVNVFEIGVATGGSLSLWSHQLRNPTITALDINPNTLQIIVPRTTLLLGDQGDIPLLNCINMKYGPFDLIVDDGSHLAEHQVTSFNCLWPLLDDGGYYVIEDLQFSCEQPDSATAMLCGMVHHLAAQPVGDQPFTITFCGSAAALQKGPTFEPPDVDAPIELDETPNDN